MRRHGPVHAAASIESSLVRIGHTGQERGVVDLQVTRFVDRDVVHPDGRECLRLVFVLEGVEVTKCKETIVYLYGQDIEKLRSAIETPCRPAHSGDSVPGS
jgi:hypothetical protein